MKRIEKSNHILPAFRFLMEDTDEKTNEIHLTYEDIIPYLPPDPPEAQNIQMGQYLKNLKEQTQKFYVKRVNELYDILQAIWPNGTPIDYYISYEYFSNLSEEEFLNKMKEPGTMQTISELVSLRKQGKSLPNPNLEAMSKNDSDNEMNFNQSDDSDEEFGYNESSQNHKKKKKKVHWTENEISVFIKLLSKKNQLKSWRAVAKNFKNKTHDECFSLYQKLLSSGQITSKYAPKKEPEKNPDAESELDLAPFNNIKAIFFEFNDQRSIVGPISESKKDQARNSPLYGHADLIMLDKMFLPAISDYGTVLDYDTWVRIIQSTQQDPYEIKPIQNKRQITVLTKENFAKYEPLIKKVGEKKVNNEEA